MTFHRSVKLLVGLGLLSLVALLTLAAAHACTAPCGASAGATATPQPPTAATTAVTSAPNPPVGFFNVPNSPNGTSDLILLGNGRYMLASHNVTGNYEINGDQITFVEDSGSDAVCLGTLGTYKWRLDNSVLTLQVVEDGCPERRSDFQDPMTLY